MKASVMKKYMSRKTGQIPLTKFIDNQNAIQSEFINGPDPESFQEVLARFASLSWFQDYKTTNDPTIKEFAARELASGSILGQGLECGRFTFVFSGLSLHLSHALVRARIGASFLQQSQAVQDFRHSNILVPRAFAKKPDLLIKWQHNIVEGKIIYGNLLDSNDIAITDARMALSKSIPVWIGSSFTLLSLMNIYAKRTDTQEEDICFNKLFAQVRHQIVEKYPYLDQCFKHDPPAKCIHTKPGYRSNCVYKRNDDHQLPYDVSEDGWTFHDKTRDELVQGLMFFTEYWSGHVKIKKEEYEHEYGKCF